MIFHAGIYPKPQLTQNSTLPFFRSSAQVLARSMRLKATGTLTPEVVEAVTPIVPLLKAVMREHYDWLQLTYEFYSVMGTSMDLSTMQKNQYVGGGGEEEWRRGVEEDE